MDAFCCNTVRELVCKIPRNFWFEWKVQYAKANNFSIFVQYFRRDMFTGISQTVSGKFSVKSTFKSISLKVIYMSILPEYVEVTSYKKRCNLITLHDSASQKRSLKFFMRTIRFSLLNFIWKYTTPFHAEEIFGIAIVRIHRTQGKPGKSGKNLENWKIRKNLENLSTQAKTHGKCLNFRSTCCNMVWFIIW